MKKYYFLLLMAVVAMFVSCSKDDVVPEEPTPVYKVRVANNIEPSLVSQKSDGVLYDVVITCSDGHAYRLGDIVSGKGVTYELPSTTPEGCIVLVFYKVGRNPIDAGYSYYISPERSYGKLLYKWLLDGETALFNITEKTTFSSTKYSKFDDLNRYFGNLVGID